MQGGAAARARAARSRAGRAARRDDRAGSPTRRGSTSSSRRSGELLGARRCSSRCSAAAARDYEDAFRARRRASGPDRVAARIGFDEGLAHLIEAGADLFLMPSRFEPCGLNQMYSLRYGTVAGRARGRRARRHGRGLRRPERAAPASSSATTTPHALMLAVRRALERVPRPARLAGDDAARDGAGLQLGPQRAGATRRSTARSPGREAAGSPRGAALHRRARGL